MARLEFQILGNPGIRVNGARVEGLPAKLEALLYYLATAPRSVSRSALAGLLWSERSEQDARMNLRAALQKIPEGMAGCVTVTRDWVAIDGAAELDVDVRRFEQVLATLSAGGEGRLQRLREGAELYRDDFLQGFSPGHAPEFESWCVAERTRLRQGAVRIITEALALERAAGLHADAAHSARRILHLAPGHDAALRELMESLARSGQRNAALEEFERHRKLWHEELGIAPSADTGRLAERIVAGESVSAPAPAAPQSTGPQLIGREREFELVSRLLTGPESRIVSITGLGGIGKTRLAQGLLAALKPRFPDGALLVSVGAMRSGATVGPALAAAFGLQIRAGNALEPLKDFLREKSVLVAFDSFEAVLGTEAVDLLLELTQAAPGLRCLVTSREALGVAEEVVVALDGLDYPRGAETTAAWRDYPAVQLFIQRAARGYVQFDPERERDGIVRLCERVQGIPLAIELAASLARSMPCVEIARAVDRDLQSLAKDDPGLSPRHRSLARVLETAFGQLGADMQGCLARLSVFRGPFRAEAAEAVAECSLRQLSSLIEKSWLRRDPATGYVLHDVVRQFAHALTAECGIDERALRGRHAAYFAGWLARSQQGIRLGNDLPLLEDARMALADLVEACEWSVAQDAAGDTECALEVLHGYFEGSGDYVSSSLFFGAILAMFDGSRKPRRRNLHARALCLHGWTLAQMGSFDEGIGDLEGALAIARATGHDDVASDALRGIGLAQAMQGKCAEAMRTLEECLAVTRGLGNPFKEMNTLNVMGLAQGGLGNGRGQVDYFRRALALAQAHRYRRGEVMASINLGEVCTAEGQLEDAERHFSAALAASREMRSKRFHVLALMNLAQVAQYRRDPVRTRELLAESVAVVREAGERRYYSFLHAAEAELAMMLRDREAQRVAGLKMVEAADAVGWDWAAAFGLAHAAQACTELGERDGAAEALRSLHQRVKGLEFEVHHASYALEASRWSLRFDSANPGARDLATACVRSLAASATVDFWAGLRARELAAEIGSSPAPEPGRGARAWMDALVAAS